MSSSLVHAVSPYLDPHMMFPIISWLETASASVLLDAMRNGACASDGSDDDATALACWKRAMRLQGETKSRSRDGEELMAGGMVEVC